MFEIWTIAILAITMVLVFLKYSKELWAPGFLTTLGVLGTFIGIFIGLVPFINQDNPDIASQIPTLVRGICLATICSIVGIVLALISKFFQRKNNFEAKQVGATADTLALLLKEMLEQQKIQNQNIHALQKAIIGDEDGTLLTQLQKIRTVFADKQDELIQSFNTFSERMAKNNSEALIDALKHVITDFNTKINEQFGDNFKQLNDAVGKLLIWQENYRQQIIELQNQFSLCLNGLQSSNDTLGLITQKTDSLVNAANSLETLLAVYDGYRQNLAEHLEAFSSLATSAKEAFPTIHDNINKLTIGLTKTIEDTNATQNKILAKQAESFDAMTDNLSKTTSRAINTQNDMLNKQYDSLDAIMNSYKDLDKLMIDCTDKTFTSIKEQIEKTVSSLEGSLREISRKIELQVTAIDKALEEELTKSLNSLGNQLASLSGKFVTDYTPLTDKLQKMLQNLSSARVN